MSLSMEGSLEFPSTWARLTPGKSAVVVAHPDPGAAQMLSYAELDSRSTRCARLFRAEGLRRGDHVAVLMENRTELLEVCWAAQRSGLYVTVVNTGLTIDETRYVVDDCAARVLVTSARLGEQAAALLEGTPTVRRRLVVGGPLAGYEDYAEALASSSAWPLSDECEGGVMLYSSGTTGRPKGVKHPASFGPTGSDFRGRELFLLLGLERSSVYLSPAPLYHAAPLGFSMAVHRLGGTVVVMPRFDAERTLELIERYRVTNAQFVPTMFIRMLRLPAATRARYDLTSLRCVVHAAAPCPVQIKRAMLDWWGPIIWEYYAGTEGNGSTLVGPDEWLAHPGTVGRAPAGGLQVHILDDVGRELGPGETGAVYFSGGGTFEYHNDPAKTASNRNEQGWSTLGDVGHLDAEGYLYLTDRLSHMIISGGVNVYPQEIENVLVMHPTIADVAVIGVPDAEMGEQVRACR